MNLLPLFAYQKIYYDFFSCSQWEKHLAYAYNVDYWNGKSVLTLAPEMLQLRYANYPKDYFMGILPSSQYGAVAVLPSTYPSYRSNDLVASNTVGNQGVFNLPANQSSPVTGTLDTTRSVGLNSDLSANLS